MTYRSRSGRNKQGCMSMDTASQLCLGFSLKWKVSTSFQSKRGKVWLGNWQRSSWRRRQIGGLLPKFLGRSILAKLAEISTSRFTTRSWMKARKTLTLQTSKTIIPQRSETQWSSLTWNHDRSRGTDYPSKPTTLFKIWSWALMVWVNPRTYYQRKTPSQRLNNPEEVIPATNSSRN